MMKVNSRGATVVSLLLALCGAILAIYVVEVIGTAIRTPYYGPMLILVVYPLLGSVFAVPMCIIATLLAWPCFVLIGRWIHNRMWAGIVAVALTFVINSAFYGLVVLILPTLFEPLAALAFYIALAVIVTVCIARGVGRRVEVASPAD